MKTSRILSADSFGRALAEIGIIVVGVLIALGADAWWTEREALDQYQTAVSALITDLDENLQRLADRGAELRSEIGLHSDRIEVIRSPASYSRDEMEEAVFGLYLYSEFDLLDGSLAATHETGVWSRLPRDARTLLSRIPVTARMQQIDVSALEEASVGLTRLFEEYGGWQGLLPADFDRQNMDLSFRAEDGDLDGLIRDSRFEHHALSLVFVALNSLDRIDLVVAELEELRAILQAELS